jgi:hypothetical protein
LINGFKGEIMGYLQPNVIDLRKKSECESLILGGQTFKKINTLAMRTKVKNILSGMKLFVESALLKREKYFIGSQCFIRRRTLDFNKLCFF